MLEGRAGPFTVPAIEGLGGGAIEVRGPLTGGSIDFRTLLDGVFVLEVLPDEAVEPSCLVGDLLGDYAISASLSPMNDGSLCPSRYYIPLTSTLRPALQRA